MAFLEEHLDSYVGIDGSDNARAYLYYRCIQNNFDYLNSIFDISGVKYYIRMLRDAKDGNCDLDDDDIISTHRPIEPYEKVKPEKLFNYFIFSLKNQAEIYL